MSLEIDLDPKSLQLLKHILYLDMIYIHSPISCKAVSQHPPRDGTRPAAQEQIHHSSQEKRDLLHLSSFVALQDQTHLFLDVVPSSSETQVELHPLEPCSDEDHHLRSSHTEMNADISCKIPYD